MERAGQNGWLVRTHTNTSLETGQNKHTQEHSWGHAAYRTRSSTHTHTYNYTLAFAVVSGNGHLAFAVHAWPWSPLLFVFVCTFPRENMDVDPGECHLCGEFQWGGISPAPGRPGSTSGEEVRHWPGAWETTEHPGAGNINNVQHLHYRDGSSEDIKDSFPPTCSAIHPSNSFSVSASSQIRWNRMGFCLVVLKASDMCSTAPNIMCYWTLHSTTESGTIICVWV